MMRRIWYYYGGEDMNKLEEFIKEEVSKFLSEYNHSMNLDLLGFESIYDHGYPVLFLDKVRYGNNLTLGINHVKHHSKCFNYLVSNS